MIINEDLVSGNLAGRFRGMRNKMKTNAQPHEKRAEVLEIGVKSGKDGRAVC